MTLFRSWWRELVSQDVGIDMLIALIALVSFLVFLIWLCVRVSDRLVSSTDRERPRFDDGSPRTQITEDGMARLTLIRGLNPGKQRVIKAEHEK